jgi:hypothetical protein
VTIASRPSCEGGTARTLRLIWVSEKAKYFFGWGWTVESKNKPSGQISWAKNGATTIEQHPENRFARPREAY